MFVWKQRFQMPTLKYIIYYFGICSLKLFYQHRPTCLRSWISIFETSKYVKCKFLPTTFCVLYVVLQKKTI